MFKIYKVEVEN